MNECTASVGSASADSMTQIMSLCLIGSGLIAQTLVPFAGSPMNCPTDATTPAPATCKSLCLSALDKSRMIESSGGKCGCTRLNG